MNAPNAAAEVARIRAVRAAFDDRLVAFIASRGEASPREVAAEFNAVRDPMRVFLDQLVTAGRLERVARPTAEHPTRRVYRVPTKFDGITPSAAQEQQP